MLAHAFFSITLLALALLAVMPRLEAGSVANARESVEKRTVMLFPCSRTSADDAIALTFDDGPDPRFTPTILDTLAEHDARATFFVIGEHAVEHPELVARIVAEGHEVAHHSHTHPYAKRLVASELAYELDQALATLEAQGIVPVWYRPPRGDATLRQLAFAAERGMRTALWTRCFERRRFRNAGEASETLCEETEPGDVILAHDGLADRSMTVEALPAYLAHLRANGIDVVTLSDLQRRAKARHLTRRLIGR